MKRQSMGGREENKDVSNEIEEFKFILAIDISNEESNTPILKAKHGEEMI